MKKSPGIFGLKPFHTCDFSRNPKKIAHLSSALKIPLSLSLSFHCCTPLSFHESLTHSARLQQKPTKHTNTALPTFTSREPEPKRQTSDLMLCFDF
jgi:hypothetical protein